MCIRDSLRRDEGKFTLETDLGYYPGRVVIAPLDENTFTVNVLRKLMSGEEVPDYDPINYKLLDNDLATLEAVSYTHLDVYKRQVFTGGYKKILAENLTEICRG